MTQQSIIRHRRASTPQSQFPELEPGEIALNTYSGDLAVGDDNESSQGKPIPLLAVRRHLASAVYMVDHLVGYQGQIWRCRVDGTTGDFTAANWEQITGQKFSQGVFNPTKVLTDNYVAQPNDWCRVDTRQHLVEITLPINPADGSSVRITDVAFNFTNNPCFVLRNTQFINGLAENLELKTVRDVTLLFTVDLGWSSVP